MIRELRLTSRYDPRKILLYPEKIEKLNKGEIPIPITIEVDPVDGFCNQDCKDCNYDSGSSKRPRFVNMKALMGVFKEVMGRGVYGIEWVGGSEPTLHPLISKMMFVAEECGLHNGLVTNGVLLNRVFDNIKERGGVDYIRVSLDAATSMTYKTIHKRNDFERVIANCKEVVRLNRAVLGFSFRVMKENVDEVVGATKLAHSLGLGYIQFKWSIQKECTKIPKELAIQLDRQLKIAREYENANFKVAGITLGLDSQEDKDYFDGCISSPLCAVIMAGGEIPFCIDRKKMYDCIGNINKGGFLKHWFGEKHKKILNLMKDKYCRRICKHHRYDQVIRENRDLKKLSVIVPKDIEVNSQFV